MPPLFDHTRVRAILETDRAWAVYALGDLEPPHAEHAAWFAAPDSAALIMLYRGFGRPVLFTLGAPEAVLPLLDEVAHEREFYLLVRPEVLPLIQQRYAVRHQQAMWRMTLAGDRARRLTAENVQRFAVERLTEADFSALEALYADGAATGEAPDFFNRAQLEHGLFYGVWDSEVLIAAAGTHLSSPALGLAAVGNVYVRRNRRGRGLGGAVTGAVTADLVRQGLDLIALNVDQGNAAAIRVYERLGYVRYCAFVEGLATRQAAA